MTIHWWLLIVAKVWLVTYKIWFSDYYLVHIIITIHTPTVYTPLRNMSERWHFYTFCFLFYFWWCVCMLSTNWGKKMRNPIWKCVHYKDVEYVLYSNYHPLFVFPPVIAGRRLWWVDHVTNYITQSACCIGTDPGWNRRGCFLVTLELLLCR